MVGSMNQLNTMLKRFNLAEPEPVAETGIAKVWKVRQVDGAPAALKIYHDLDDKGEGPGVKLLQAWHGGPAATVIAQDNGVVVLEWLDGQTLGDVSRGGDDTVANDILIETATRCHAMNAPVLPDYKEVEATFQALFNLEFAADCPAEVVASVNACKELAKQLFATAPEPKLLHGDLHHDNVLEGARGWCVIDPKGVVGDPAYELANAFRNPLGNDAIIRDTQRTQDLAKNWAEAVGCTPKRALSWAAAHAAVSMAWSCDGKLGEFPDSDLPAFYLAQRAQA